MTPREIEMLESFAERLAEEPDFMAFILGTYKKTEGLTDSDLEIRLGLTHESLIQLKLCHRPLSSTQQKDLHDIAAFTGVDAAVIAQIINQVDFLLMASPREGRTSSSPHHLALAARKRNTQPSRNNEDS